jgi:uncharacterized protein (TIGR03437 family)
MNPYTGLATSYDGSVLYFASTLRIKGSGQPTHGKLFVVDANGVQLFRSRNKVEAPPAQYPGQCVSGPYYAYYRAEVTADGRTVAGAMNQAADCKGQISATNLISASGERQFSGMVRLSAKGRYAIEYADNLYAAPSVKYVDLSTGMITAVVDPVPLGLAADSGRIIADNGTALIGGYLLRPGSPPVPWPLSRGASSAVLDAAADHILYAVEQQTPGPLPGIVESETRLEVLDMATNQTRVLGSGNITQNMLSDDGALALWVENNQVFVFATDGSGRRAALSDPAGITTAVLSGDGKVIWAGTGEGRLLKFNVDTGAMMEVVGRTPFLGQSVASFDAGMMATISGAGLSNTPLQGTPPLDPWLGNLTMWMGDRKVPMFALSPNQVSFLIPWNTAANQNAPVLAEVAGEHSPFDFPQTTITVRNEGRAGATAHQDWSSISYTGPFQLGEIVHVWAVGLGAVTPEVPPGTVAPSTEPLARLASPLTCQDADVLYAGLAPGYLERVYQVDIRLNATGYRRFDCSANGKPILALTFDVVP